MIPAQNAANDNERVRSYRMTRSAFGRRSPEVGHPVQNDRRDLSPQIPADIQFDVRKQKPQSDELVRATEPSFVYSRLTGSIVLLLWIISAVNLFYADMTALTSGIKTALAGVMALTSLCLAYLCGRNRRPVYRSLGLLGFLFAITAVGFYLSQELNLAPSPHTILVAGALSTVLSGALIKEPVLLNISAILTIGWAGLAFISAQIPELYWLLPAIISFQLFASRSCNSETAKFLSSLSSCLWILNGALFALNL